MARAYSQDLRARVLDAVSGGSSIRQAAVRFGVGVTMAIVWAGRARTHGETTARRQGRPEGSKRARHADFRLGLVAATPDITLTEMQERLLRDRGVEAGIGTLRRFFDARAVTAGTTPYLHGIATGVVAANKRNA